MIRVKVSNLDRLVKTLGDRMSRAVRTGTAAAGAKIVDALALASDDFAVTETFRNGWVADAPDTKGHVISVKVRNTARYARHVEFGRDPGKAPPFNEIADWAYDVAIIPYRVRRKTGSRTVADDGTLDGVDLSVGKRKVRTGRTYRKRQYRHVEGAEHERSPAATVGAIVNAIAQAGTKGKFVLNNSTMRARMLRILRAQVSKAIRDMTRADVS